MTTRTELEAASRKRQEAAANGITISFDAALRAVRREADDQRHLRPRYRRRP